MKVNIGKHIDWFGPYQLAELLCFWEKKEHWSVEVTKPYKEKFSHKLGHFFAHGFQKEIIDDDGYVKRSFEDLDKTWLYKLLMWVHEKRSRKVNVIVEENDVWNLHETLCLVIVLALKSFKDYNRNGCPGHIDHEDLPKHIVEEIESYSEDYTEPKYCKAWEWVLDEMIFSFEHSTGDSDWESQFIDSCFDVKWKKVIETNPINGEVEEMTSMVYGENYKYEVDEEGMKSFQDRITNGRRLFAKYYEHLWD